LIPVYSYFMPRITRTVTYLTQSNRSEPKDGLSLVRTLYAFARTVREVTPETKGFLDRSLEPEYGLLVPPSHGHLFTYVAHRPVPANNLGPHLDPDLFDLADSFYRAVDSQEAIEILSELQVRYFVTSLSLLNPGTFAQAVHRRNDISSIRQRSRSTGRVRLIAAGPKNGRPIELVGPPERRSLLPPLKLFEFVEGAVLVAQVEPNALAVARLELRTPRGTSRHSVSQRADESGLLRLRVPYPSETGGPDRPPIHAVGVWRVYIGNDRYDVIVGENDVQEGHEVDLGSPVRRALDE
ncbi:MAG: hypothetical protein V3T64_13375, partial [Myxococcota bacterium]